MRSPQELEREFFAPHADRVSLIYQTRRHMLFAE